jgi:hypothetical protein
VKGGAFVGSSHAIAMEPAKSDAEEWLPSRALQLGLISAGADMHVFFELTVTVRPLSGKEKNDLVLSAGFAECSLKQLKAGSHKLTLSGGALACPSQIDKTALSGGRKRFGLGFRKPSRLRLTVQVGNGASQSMLQLPSNLVLDTRLLAPISAYWASLAVAVFGRSDHFDPAIAAFPQIMDRPDLTTSFCSLWEAGLGNQSPHLLRDTSDDGASEALLLRQCMLRLWPLLHVCRDVVPHDEPTSDLSLMQDPEQILTFTSSLVGWQPFRTTEGLIQAF